MNKVLVLAALLVVCPALTVAQASPSGILENSNGMNSETPYYGGHEWGWLGLLGLVGLAGLRRPKDAQTRRLEATGVDVKTVKV